MSGNFENVHCCPAGTFTLRLAFAVSEGLLLSTIELGDTESTPALEAGP